jgi:hypothetical protein
MIELLKKAELTEGDAASCTDTILGNPKKYGFAAR